MASAIAIRQSTDPVRLTRFVKRPEPGTIGKRISIRSNVFRVNQFPKGNIPHYDVEIKATSGRPDLPVALNRMIFHRFTEVHRNDIGNVELVYDGRKNAFASAKPAFNGAFSTTITLPEDSGPPSRSSPREFKIQLRKVSDINLMELHRFFERKNEMTNNCLTAIMALDVALRHQASLNYLTINRSIYPNMEGSNLSGGLRVFQGLYQALRAGGDSLLVNLDLTATPFYHDGPLDQIACAVLSKRGPNDMRQELSKYECERLNRFVKRLRIKVTHQQGRERKYKIEKLSPLSASRTVFEKPDGGKINVTAYFASQYNLHLRFPNLPCVITRGGYFPLEVCYILPKQRCTLKLDPQQTADMIKVTTQKPHLRMESIRQGARSLNYAEDKSLRAFGIRIDPNMMTVPARVIPPPSLTYHASSQRGAIFKPDGGAWNMMDKKVVNGATLGSWGVVIFESERFVRRPAVENFIRELCKVCSSRGLNITKPNPPISYGNAQGNIEQILRQAYMAAGNASKSDPQMLVCIIPLSCQSLYGEIKRVGETVLGIPTQNLRSKNVGRPNNQYLTNVSIKINAKLGGVNVLISPDQLKFISQKPTMVIGADVVHPPPGEKFRPSFVGLVSSIDVRLGQFYSSIRMQESGSEIIADLKNMISESLRTFFRTSGGHKPHRILFYRDGVSEGRFDEVFNSEVMAIKEACEAIEPGYNPTLTFVIVQKRHHVRLFPLERSDADRSGNCSPGTVVDTTLTHPHAYDFYLQSHAGLLGTSRCAHYHVLHDENRLGSDALQELTYRMCYLYARCTRSVSIVPVVYYADLLAARARFYSPSENISETASVSSSEAGQFVYGKLHDNLKCRMFHM